MKKEVVEMMGKTYGDVRNGKIVVMFYGEIGNICVMVKSRVKLLEVLKRFRRDEKKVMEWVSMVVISNPYSGMVKINGKWKYRKRVYEFRINHKSNNDDDNGGTSEMSVDNEGNDKDSINDELVLVNQGENEYKYVEKEYNGLKMVCVKDKNVKKVKMEVKKKYDKWVKVNDMEVNWSRNMIFSNGQYKKYRSKLDMLSKVVNGKVVRRKKNRKFDIQKFGGGDKMKLIDDMLEDVNKMVDIGNYMIVNGTDDESMKLVDEMIKTSNESMEVAAGLMGSVFNEVMDRINRIEETENKQPKGDVKNTMMRTALVRSDEGNLRIYRYDDYNNQKDFAEDLRGNGYKVLKIWNGYISDAEADEWEYLNRK